jgi:hypothetical protein
VRLLVELEYAHFHEAGCLRGRRNVTGVELAGPLFAALVAPEHDGSGCLRLEGVSATSAGRVCRLIGCS